MLLVMATDRCIIFADGGDKGGEYSYGRSYGGYGKEVGGVENHGVSFNG